MRDRFTERAKQALRLANQEAHRFNHEVIGTEHILIGLVQLGAGVAATILKPRGVTVETVRQILQRMGYHGPGNNTVCIGRLGHTPGAERVIDWACEEARLLCHDYVCTEHLLMGLLREREDVAAAVLREFGLTVENTRDAILLLSPPGCHPATV